MAKKRLEKGCLPDRRTPSRDPPFGSSLLAVLAPTLTWVRDICANQYTRQASRCTAHTTACVGVQRSDFRVLSARRSDLEKSTRPRRSSRCCCHRRPGRTLSWWHVSVCECAWRCCAPCARCRCARSGGVRAPRHRDLARPRRKVRRSSSALDGPFCERFCVLFWRVCISHFLQF